MESGNETSSTQLDATCDTTNIQNDDSVLRPAAQSYDDERQVEEDKEGSSDSKEADSSSKKSPPEKAKNSSHVGKDKNAEESKVSNQGQSNAKAPSSSEDSDEDEEEEEEVSQTDEDKYSIVEVSPKNRFKRFNDLLGSGAYKEVYRGIDEDTGREIAWNVIKINKLPKIDRKRISDEIHTLKSMKEHPNIIHFISAWVNKSKEEVIFITEMVTAGSLRQYLKKIKKPRLKVIK